jgi:hypothetical protein
MGLKPKSLPVPVVRAVIDSDFAPTLAEGRAADDLIELD